jgi:2-keto-4-pentenoate hydratase
MVDTSDAGAELLTRVTEARRLRSTIDSQMSPVDLTVAYEVQAARLAGSKKAGYKLGLTSAAKQQQMGIDRPIHGVVAVDMLRQDEIAISDFIQPRMEPELVSVIGKDIESGASARAAREAVAAQFLAVDVLDCIWTGYRFVLTDVVSDNVSAGAFLMDERLLDPVPDDILALFLNGQQVSAGPVDALGDPGAQLARLAVDVGGVHAGEVVFMGSPAQAIEIHPGVLELRGPGGAALVAEVHA